MIIIRTSVPLSNRRSGYIERSDLVASHQKLHNWNDANFNESFLSFYISLNSMNINKLRTDISMMIWDIFTLCAFTYISIFATDQKAQNIIFLQYPFCISIVEVDHKRTHLHSQTYERSHTQSQTFARKQHAKTLFVRLIYLQSSPTCAVVLPSSPPPSPSSSPSPPSTPPFPPPLPVNMLKLSYFN